MTAAQRFLVALPLVGALSLRPTSAHAAWPHNPGVNLPVCTAAGGQYSPVTVSDGKGGAIVAWADARGADYDIYAQHILLSGAVDPAWPANGRALCTAATNQTTPMLVADGAGGGIVVWADLRNGNFDIFAQHVLASGAVDPAWPANGRALCTAAAEQNSPVLVSDGAGGAVAAWTDFRSGVNYDIYAHHVLASGAVDPLWPANGRALCTAAGIQFNPVIAADGAGGAIVAWYDGRVPFTDIYAQHVLAGGAVDGNWPVDGRAICTAAGNQYGQAIVPDGAGGAIITWQDLRNGVNFDIYAQHVVAQGFVDGFWPPDGRQLCGAAGDQQFPSVAMDGAGGAIVTWQDNRGASLDIYAQHAMPYGGVDPLWPVDGRAVCTAAGSQQSPVIIADGAGGSIVAWSDSRFGTSDVYAEHVQATGAVDGLWPIQGRGVSTAASHQIYPWMIDDGAGGAIVAWDDVRSGIDDIYAQRVARFGYLGTPEAEMAGVHDVANDQGGKVRVAWYASWLDAESDPNFNLYEVWRSVAIGVASDAAKRGARVLSSFAEAPDSRGAGALASAGGAPDSRGAGALASAGGAPGPRGRTFVIPASPTGGQLYAWEYLASQSAVHYIPVYSYVAPTLSDSTGAYNPPTAFMVVGRNTSGSMYWVSRPDSGYSVDNLAPAPPAPFLGAYSAGATHLHWGANAELDLAGYRLYRGSSPSFVPGPGNLVSAQPDTGYDDSGAAGSWYKLSAVDSHGNESVFAVLGPGATTDAPGAGPYALEFAPPAPNPVRGDGASFRIVLPVEAPVSLTIFDQQGRRVAEVLRATLPAGERSVRWDGRDAAGRAVASGVYFARLEALGRSLRVRFAVLR